MKSVVSLSLGQAGSFACQHFFNIQQEEQNAPFFYESKTQSAPRLLCINFANDIGPLPWNITDFKEPAEEQAFGNAEKIPEKKEDEIDLEIRDKPLSDYHKNKNEGDVDEEVKLFEEWNANKRAHFIREPRRKFNIQDQYYSDFQEIQHDQIIPLFYNLNNYDQIYQKFYTTPQLHNIEDQVQQQLERCDYVDGFNFFENSQTNMSYLGTEVLNYIQQECGKQPVFIYDVNPEYQTKFNLQMNFNQLLQQIDSDSSHHVIINYDISSNLYESTSRPGLLVSGLMKSIYDGGFSLDSVQRGLVVCPQRRYVKSSHFILDHNLQVQDTFGRQPPEDLTLSAFSGVSGFCFNPAECSLDQALIQSESQPDFVTYLMKLQKFTSDQAASQLESVNTYYQNLLEQESTHKRFLRLKTNQIKLSKTFPHVFRGNIKYRTDANLKFSLLNTPIIRNDLINIKTDMNKRKQSGKYAKYFQRTDRDDAEIEEHMCNVFESYQSYKFKGDICTEWKGDEEESD
ncbi:Conserved_hypothetical protein [Hexamita inflata]|uniref:Uncharacterized protein n=1 Tax=Hexamita inflata TaxID=28002 RepID=A0AA86RT28_9EUKA|nr:Conserved hypothetical protein [Hexamita inflata]